MDKDTGENCQDTDCQYYNTKMEQFCCYSDDNLRCWKDELKKEGEL